jgi:hypothetical protein
MTTHTVYNKALDLKRCFGRRLLGVCWLEEADNALSLEEADRTFNKWKPKEVTIKCEYYITLKHCVHHQHANATNAINPTIINIGSQNEILQVEIPELMGASK